MADLPAYYLIGALVAAVIALLVHNSILVGRNREHLNRQMKLARCASTDPLTGLHNRLIFNQLNETCGPDFGVVAMLDLDKLKHINDQLGHEAGDEVLRAAADFIRASVRKHDLACRWGGDEFVLAFKNQSVDAVELRLRHIEQRLWQFRLRRFGRLPLRVSWGVAPVLDGALQEAIRVADGRMYEMKRRRKPAEEGTTGAAIESRAATA